MYKLLVAVFDAIDRGLSAVGGLLRGMGRSLVDGPLMAVAFSLILLVTGLRVLVTTALRELDDLTADLERALISVALLAMTALSFLDYLQREVGARSFEIHGGANMAVVLMVWVGFLGASLATRENQHLAVDSSDRLLSPAAARLVKRFSAFAAAAFCWNFADYARELVDESVASGSGQDALPLWDWLVGPINALGSLLFDGTGTADLVGIGAAVVLAGVIILRRRFASALPNGPQPSLTIMGVTRAVGILCLLVGGLSLLGHRWQPEGADGQPVRWTELQTRDESVTAGGAELEKLNAELDALVFGDTGAPGEGEAKATGPTAAELLRSSSGGNKFPQWLAQGVIPLAFVLMALRFLGIAIGGRFHSDLPPPPTHLAPTTGRSAKDLILAGLIPGLILGLAAAAGLPLGWAILLGAVALVLVGAPLFLAIGVAALAAVTLIQGVSGYTVAKDMFDAVKKEELLAIPFFVLAGNIMTNGSIAERLVSVARAAMSRIPGGLGLAAVFACVIFAAISGSSPVTVIAVGGVMFPMLVRDRYPERYSIGVLTTAGSLGIIIPPSVPMIVYAIMVSNQHQQVSPNDLFVAGVLPGLFIASILVVYTLDRTRPSRVTLAPYEPPGGKSYFPNLFDQIRRSALSLLLPVLILGGIYGILGPLRFTVTEAAAVAVVYALVVELIFHREMKLRDLPRVLGESGMMMGSLFLIIVLAIAFNKFLAEQYIPQNAAAWLQAHVTSKGQFLLLANIFLLGVGCVMDIVSAILIVAPLLAPIAAAYGIDPIHFGIIFIVNLELGYLTPPMGINLFVASTVFKRSIVEVIRSVVPFVLIMLFCLAVISWMPWLSLTLLDK